MLWCFRVPVIKYFQNCQALPEWRGTRGQELSVLGCWDRLARGVEKELNSRSLRLSAPSRGHNAEVCEAARDGRALRCRDGCRAIPAEGPFFFWLQVTTQKHSQNQGGCGFFNW